MLTIVAYHYVREIINSRYPKIKGLEVDGFRRQLDYLESNYKIIEAEDLIKFACERERALPENSCLLTFDDGYKDHIDYVLPELLKRHIQGSFFPPAKPLIDREMLDVNSIHFILACCSDIEKLVRDLNELCLANGVKNEELKYYWDTYAIAERFNAKEVVYFKRMLQHVLPEEMRNRITKTIFAKYVGRESGDFVDELYMTIDDARGLVESGMYVGSHGYRHLWLDQETKLRQAEEINLSLNFLNTIGAPTKNWIMCYPKGAYNADTIEVLKENHCSVGLTGRVGAAEIDSDNLLELPRFDTNDLPQQHSACL